MADSLEFRCQNVLYQLLNAEGYLTVESIAKVQQMSKRSIYYDISKINDFLEQSDIQPIFFKRGKGIYLTPLQKKEIRLILKEKDDQLSIFLKPEERSAVIILSVLLEEKKHHVKDFSDMCQVSRNTTLSDLKQVKGIVENYGLSLNYEVKTGYQINGDEMTQRTVFFKLFPALRGEIKTFLLHGNEDRYDLNYANLKKVERLLAASYVEETMTSLAFFLVFFPRKQHDLQFEREDVRQIQHSDEYIAVAEVFPELSEPEKNYLALHMLGGRLQTFVKTEDLADKAKINRLAQGLVAEFSRISCIEFEEEERLVQNVYAHLKSSIYRYRYGIQIGNPLIKDIKQQYPELFALTSKAAGFLERELGYPINEDEIAYLTLHFGAFLKPEVTDEQLHILIICSNGIATGNMLKGEVAALVPHARRIQVVPLRDYEKYKQNFQVIISTVSLEQDEDFLLVHPILTDSDRLAILKRCVKQETRGRVSIDELMTIIAPYVSVHKRSMLESELTFFLSNHYHHEFSAFSEQRGLLEYVTEDQIQIFDDLYSWEESIYLSAKPLVQKGAAALNYPKEIIAQMNKMGPYMFITPQVVLAHAAEGAILTDIAVNIFKTPIIFPKEREAKVILTLTAEDQVKHMKILQDVMKCFADGEVISRLIDAPDKKAVLAILNNLMET